jgi:WD40 repeat protein
VPLLGLLCQPLVFLEFWTLLWKPPAYKVWQCWRLTVLACCCCRVLRGHTGWINDVVLSRSGNQAVTVSGDGTSRVWETKTNKCLHVSCTHRELERSSVQQVYIQVPSLQQLACKSEVGTGIFGSTWFVPFI